MKTRYVLQLAALFLFGITAAQAQQKVLKEFSWSELAKAGQVKQGTVVTLPDKSEALKIENAGGDPLQATVLTIENPGIQENFHMVRGQVRYDDVAGDGYLEMWNHFGEEAYFSRTMGEAGPMAKLKGTSNWRPFLLPFNAEGAKGKPTKLVINVVLPGKGTVYLRGLVLSEVKKNAGAAAVSPNADGQQGNAWWTNQTAGLIGAIGGVLLGCLGGMIEWCAARGKSRQFVIGTARVLIGIGVVSLVLGAFAAFIRQPYFVWYVLLLLGVICVLVFPFRLRRYLEQYQRVELRRMSAIDAA